MDDFNYKEDNNTNEKLIQTISLIFVTILVVYLFVKIVFL